MQDAAEYILYTGHAVMMRLSSRRTQLAAVALSTKHAAWQAAACHGMALPVSTTNTSRGLLFLA